MSKKVSASHAKAQLSALAAEVAYGSEHIVIERHGKPIAALVSIDSLEYLEQHQPVSAQPGGALAMVGAWRDVEEADLESIIEDIYAKREKDTGRQVELEV